MGIGCSPYRNSFVEPSLSMGKTEEFYVAGDMLTPYTCSGLVVILWFWICVRGYKSGQLGFFGTAEKKVVVLLIPLAHWPRGATACLQGFGRL